MKFLVKNKIYTYSIILSFIIITVIRLITVDHNIPSKLFMDACIQSCICICADLAWDAPGVGGKFASRYIKDDQSFVWALVAALVPSVYYAVILNFTGLYLSFGEFIPGFFIAFSTMKSPLPAPISSSIGLSFLKSLAQEPLYSDGSKTI